MMGVKSMKEVAMRFYVKDFYVKACKAFPRFGGVFELHVEEMYVEQVLNFLKTFMKIRFLYTLAGGGFYELYPSKRRWRC